MGANSSGRTALSTTPSSGTAVKLEISSNEISSAELPALGT